MRLGVGRQANIENKKLNALRYAPCALRFALCESKGINNDKELFQDRGKKFAAAKGLYNH
jgi:hypothetical protein